MTRDEIREAVLAGIHTIAPDADVAAVSPDADLGETLDLDSLDFQRLLAHLQDTLHVPLPASIYARLRTLGGCVEYLAAHGASR